MSTKINLVYYNTSESICGVPKDEISLDPVLTNKYKSTVATKILPTFAPESIDYSSCPSNGILTISGKMTEKLNEAKKINYRTNSNKTRRWRLFQFKKYKNRRKNIMF